MKTQSDGTPVLSREHQCLPARCLPGAGVRGEGQAVELIAAGAADTVRNGGPTVRRQVGNGLESVGVVGVATVEGDVNILTARIVDDFEVTDLKADSIECC